MPTLTCGSEREGQLDRGHRVDQCKPGTDGSLGIILVCLRIAEIDEYAVAHVLGYEAAKVTHRLGDALLIGRNDLAQVLRVHAG